MSSNTCSPETPSFDLTPAIVLARLGCRPGVESARWLPRIEEAVETVRRISSPRLCSGQVTVEREGTGGVRLDGTLFRSGGLAERLVGCVRGTAFLLTLGSEMDAEIDLLVGRPSLQVVLDAAASEAAEACARWLQKREAALAVAAGARTLHRFSPGYGDFGIESQGWFVSLFPELGIEIAPSGMMIPRKSISGVIGWRTC